jgi:hypothetical protein
VHRAGEQLLAGARFTEDGDGGRRRRDALDQLGELPHRGIITDDALVVAGAHAGGYGLEGDLGLAHFERGVEGQLGFEQPHAAQPGAVGRVLVAEHEAVVLP